LKKRLDKGTGSALKHSQASGSFQGWDGKDSGLLQKKKQAENAAPETQILTGERLWKPKGVCGRSVLQRTAVPIVDSTKVCCRPRHRRGQFYRGANTLALGAGGSDKRCCLNNAGRCDRLAVKKCRVEGRRLGGLGAWKRTRMGQRGPKERSGLQGEPGGYSKCPGGYGVVWVGLGGKNCLGGNTGI